MRCSRRRPAALDEAHAHEREIGRVDEARGRRRRRGRSPAAGPRASRRGLGGEPGRGAPEPDAVVARGLSQHRAAADRRPQEFVPAAPSRRPLARGRRRTDVLEDERRPASQRRIVRLEQRRHEGSHVPSQRDQRLPSGLATPTTIRRPGLPRRAPHVAPADRRRRAARVCAHHEWGSSRSRNAQRSASADAARPQRLQCGRADVRRPVARERPEHARASAGYRASSRTAQKRTTSLGCPRSGIEPPPGPRREAVELRRPRARAARHRPASASIRPSIAHSWRSPSRPSAVIAADAHLRLGAPHAPLEERAASFSLAPISPGNAGRSSASCHPPAGATGAVDRRASRRRRPTSTPSDSSSHPPPATAQMIARVVRPSTASSFSAPRTRERSPFRGSRGHRTLRARAFAIRAATTDASATRSTAPTGRPIDVNRSPDWIRPCWRITAST